MARPTPVFGDWDKRLTPIFIYISYYVCSKLNLSNFDQTYRNNNNIFNTNFISWDPP